MKSIIYLVMLLITPVLFTGCDATETSAEDVTTEVPATPEGMVELDLSTHPVAGLPLVMNVPDESAGLPELLEGPAGGLQVIVGNNFNVEILPSTGDMQLKKDEISNNGLFEVEWVTDEPHTLVYTYKTPGGDITQHHFYVIREINGAFYEIMDVVPAPEEYSLTAIKTMAEAASSLRAAPAAS